MNSVKLTGRLVREASKFVYSDKSIGCYFTLAVPKSMKKDSKTDFISCKAFNGTAEHIIKFGKKGLRMLVDGSLSTWTSKENNNNTVTRYNVIANNVEFYWDSPSAANSGSTNSVIDNPFEM